MTEKFYTPVSVPDGKYKGRWGGYEVNFEFDGKEVHFYTTIGVRGINIPCTFNVVDSKLDETTLKAK